MPVTQAQGAASTRFQIQLVGLPHIVNMLSDSEVYKEPWKKGLEAIAKVAEQFAIGKAPMFRGTTIAKMSWRVQNKPVPLYAVVKTTAKRRGYSYPRLLEYTSKWHHLGWMVNAIRNSESTWGGILDTVCANIAKKWGS